MGRGKATCDATKLMIKRLIEKKKLTLKEIAELIGVSPSVVSKLKTKINSGVDLLQNLKKNNQYGKKTTERGDQLIKTVVMENRSATLNEINKKLKTQGIYIARNTLRRRLKSFGLKSCRKVNKFMLNDQMMKRRLTWAKNHKHFSVDDWRKVSEFKKVKKQQFKFILSGCLVRRIHDPFSFVNAWKSLPTLI